MTKIHGLRGVLVLAGAAGLAACGSEADAPAAAEDACPEGVSITDGWLALPAVEGNPGAAYFDLTNGGDAQVMIRSADVLGADSADIHDMGEWQMEQVMNEVFSIPVASGETVRFEPGAKHVMANGISVAPGTETEVTVRFTGGAECSFPVATYPAGEQPEGFEPSAGDGGEE